MERFTKTAMGFVCLSLLFLSCHRNTIESPFWRQQFPEYQYVRLGAIDTRYQIIGKGPPVLLLHGLGTSQDMFHLNVPALSENFTLYLLDIRGMGFSSKPRGIEYSVYTQLSHIVLFMNHFQIQKPSIWGHSLGGYLALLMALTLPERVDRLIVSDPPVYQTRFPSLIFRMLGKPVLGKIMLWVPAKWATKYVLKEVYEDDKRFVTKERINEAHEIFTLPGGRNALRELVRSVQFEEGKYFESLLPNLKIPTLILWGEKDNWFPVELGKRLHQEIPNSKFHIIANAGHHALEEAPEQINPLVLNFLLKE